MQDHRRRGEPVVLVTTGPHEVADPVGRRLGADHVKAGRTGVAGGTSTGGLERHAHGRAEAEEVQRLAGTCAHDLVASSSSSDSGTDPPLLEAVGHSCAVDPDRDLLRAARECGWPVLHVASSLPRAARVRGAVARSGQRPVARAADTASAVLVGTLVARAARRSR